MDRNLKSAAQWQLHAAERVKQANAEITELIQHSDRELVVVGASILDMQLAELITLKLIDLPDEEDRQRVFRSGDSPLKSLGAKITMAWALGLIPAVMRDELRLIARIRNEFAHSLDCRRLDAPHPAAKCRSLRLIDKSGLTEVLATDRWAIEEGRGFVDGQPVGLAIVDEQSSCLAYTGELRADLSQPRDRFINSIFICFVALVALMLVNLNWSTDD